jgi:aminopeptidase N
MKYLSNKSLEAVQKEAGWTAIETDADPETLWQLVELKHKVHSSSEVEAVMKLVARTQLVSTRQGAFESIISFTQLYNNALKAYNDQKNPTMKPKDIAMEFFSKLDNG